MSDQAMELTRSWAMRELTYCILNGWAVEFHPLNGGTDLQIRISKCGKHAYQIIPFSTTIQFYMKIWEVMTNLRQAIMEEFPYVET